MYIIYFKASLPHLWSINLQGWIQKIYNCCALKQFKKLALCGARLLAHILVVEWQTEMCEARGGILSATPTPALHCSWCCWTWHSELYTNCQCVKWAVKDFNWWTLTSMKPEKIVEESRTFPPLYTADWKYDLFPLNGSKFPQLISIYKIIWTTWCAIWFHKKKLFVESTIKF